MVNPAAQSASDTLNAARRWTFARRRLNALGDSKSATKSQIAAAKRSYFKASEELERFVVRLEQTLASTGQKVPMTKHVKGGKPFPWANFLGAISVGAKAVQDAIGTDGAPPQDPGGVIDSEGK